jgi:predicted Rossmann fold nucleotide-binding protein DprA/Smf involved in DNA uptake
MVSDFYSTNVRAIAIDMPLFAAARKSDPTTSHAAAARVKEFRSQQHAAILEALAAGPAGASRIAERCGLNSHQVGKRLHELEAAGRIALTGRTVASASRRGEREWRCA